PLCFRFLGLRLFSAPEILVEHALFGPREARLLLLWRSGLRLHLYRKVCICPLATIHRGLCLLQQDMDRSSPYQAGIVRLRRVFEMIQSPFRGSSLADPASCGRQFLVQRLWRSGMTRQHLVPYVHGSSIGTRDHPVSVPLSLLLSHRIVVADQHEASCTNLVLSQLSIRRSVS